MAKPKLALIPAAQGNKLYSVLPVSGVGDFDFTRGSLATRINREGFIETVGSGVSRLDYPIINGAVNGCPSHLLEPVRQNLVINNNDVTGWQSGQVSKFANEAISPDGTQNASKVSVVQISNSHWFQQTFNIGENNVSISAYVKNIDADFIQITNAGNANAYVNFDIKEGTIGSSGSAMSNPKIEKLPNDWYRISVSVDNTGTPITYMRFYIVNSAFAPFNQSWLPTSDVSLYFWGSQCEIGEFETSVIPTTTSVVTRSDETANGSGDAATFNDSEGVLMAEINTFDDTTVKSITIGDGTSSNRIQLFYFNGASIYGACIVGGVSQASQFTNIDVSTNIKVAFKYKVNDFALWVNGFEVGIDTNGTVPTGLNILRFDSGVGTSNFCGNTKQLQYFDSSLNDSDLETLTSWVSFTDMANGQLYTIE